ncbi:MAG: hypothetical protein DWQ37_08375 [Planctomycetota bacterium]|nr:MAG: hypothetical protein DWQ37_08375 [Planctomycetota bacterium]
MGCRLRLLLAIALTTALPLAAGCSRAGGAPERASLEAQPQENQLGVEATLYESERLDAVPLDDLGRLDRLRQQGRFEEFIDQALNVAAEQPDRAILHTLRCEALLASGRNDAAESAAHRAAQLACDAEDTPLATAALKLWATARFRQGKSLDDPQVARWLATLPAEDEAVQMLLFWQQAIGSPTTFRIDDGAGGSYDVPLADSVAGSLPFELNAIQARANGVAQPLVFIDTGAAHTLITVEAADRAGVERGTSTTRLVGFAGLVAQPAVLETLELGNLVLHDVPVLVGDSPPLTAQGGQMSLGTELMHHVRFHIDYPGRRVTVEPAGWRDFRRGSTPFWKIPLWTFSQVCLARGQTGDGAMARVLVDTGDRAGTFVSYRWGRRHLPPLRAATSPVVFRFQKRNLALEELDLGTQTLFAWRVEDTIPNELDRLNLVDILVGHDLLWPYRLTIDLPGRVLELHSGTSPRDPAARAPHDNGENDGNQP